MEISSVGKKGYVLRGGKTVFTVCDLLKLSISEFEEVMKFHKHTDEHELETYHPHINSFFKMMREWFVDYTFYEPREKNIIASYLEKTKECKGKSSWVTYVSHPRVYRGISRPIEDIRRIKLSNKTVGSYILGTVLYDPKQRVQSWTRDRDQAFLFRSSGPEVEWLTSLQWIMSFKPSEQEVIFGSEFTDLVSPMRSEREVVVSIPNNKKVTVAINLEVLFAPDDSNMLPKRLKGKTLENVIGKENAEMIRSSNWYKNYFNTKPRKKP